MHHSHPLRVLTDEHASPHPIQPAALQMRHRLRRLVPARDLRNQPPLSWSIETLLPERALVGLVGASGDFKTVLALHISLCIATGHDFFGLPAKQAAVVYVAGEGFIGHAKRVEAWFTEHGVADAPLYLLDDAIQMLDAGDVANFVTQLREKEVEPGLIVIDTLARAFVGGDENTQKDMSRFISAADTLRREFNATVLVIHHTGKDGKRERGSSVFKSDVDVMIGVKADHKAKRPSVTIRCDKMRDAEKFAERTMSVVEVGDSLVLRRSLNEIQEKCLRALASFEVTGARFSEWQRACGVAESTLSRAKEVLKEWKLIEHDAVDGVYRVTHTGLSTVASPAPVTVEHVSGFLTPHTASGDVDGPAVDLDTQQPSASAEQLSPVEPRAVLASESASELSLAASSVVQGSESAGEQHHELSLDAPPYKGALAKARVPRPYALVARRRRSCLIMPSVDVRAGAASQVQYGQGCLYRLRALWDG